MNNKPYVMPLDISQAQVAVDALHAAEALCQHQPGPTSLRVYVEAKFEAGTWTASALAEVERLRETLEQRQADDAHLTASLAQAVSERKKARAEAERLRADYEAVSIVADGHWHDAERLRAGIKDLVDWADGLREPAVEVMADDLKKLLAKGGAA